MPNASSAVTIGNTSNGNVTEDLASARAASLSILGGNTLKIKAGDMLTVGGATTVNGALQVGFGGILNTGSLTNNLNLTIGPGSTVNVTGTFTNTGTLMVEGFGADSALLKAGGAAPGTLTGQWEIQSNPVSAAVEWGSGGITAIGDGGSHAGSVQETGANAYLEVGVTNSNSALAGLTTIASNGQLGLSRGASLTTSGALTNGGYLTVDDGSSLTLGGSLANSGTMQIGDSAMTSASTVTVPGTFTNGNLSVYGGGATGANGLLNVGGAAPGALTGYYTIEANVGSAAVEWGSGGITSIGGGSGNPGYVLEQGAGAYLEVGATNSNSALAGLTTIASNGQLELEDGASLTTTGALTVDGELLVGSGSSVNLGGSLTNGGSVQIDGSMSVAGTFNNTGATLQVGGLLNVSGAAPATLTGTYQIESFNTQAAVEWGSGGITSIGDGGSNPGSVLLQGAKTYLEVGATNSNSALAGLATIASNGSLQLEQGASVTTAGALTNNGQLWVDYGGNNPGGSSLNVGGSLTNSGSLEIGSSGMSSASTVTVAGTFDNTAGGSLTVNGGNAKGANGLLNVSGSAPGTLTGLYQLYGSTGSAAVEWGSGAITTIGDGGSNGGAVMEQGSNAYLEVGATNSNSALQGLTTIASNGSLLLENGATLTTAGALTNSGVLSVEEGGSLSVRGTLTNSGQMGVGGTFSASTVQVSGAFNNTGGTLIVQGYYAGSGGLLNISGAAPGTLTGSYEIGDETLPGAPAAVEWGSGGITSIGDGGSNAGSVLLQGSNAYLEVGATNSNSALKGLTTIAGNGTLTLQFGAALATTRGLTNNGKLYLDNYIGPGGSSLSIAGVFTNGNYVELGNNGMISPSTVSVAKSFVNNSTGTVDLYGGGASAANAVLNVAGPYLANSGTINLNGNTGAAELVIGSNLTLTGTGKINLSNDANNIITGAAPTDTLTNASTIRGSGAVQNIGIVNNGLILANQSTPLIISPSAAGLNNQGSLSVSAGSTLQIDGANGGSLLNFSGTTLAGGAYKVAGTLEFDGANIVTNAANIALASATAAIVNQGSTNALLGFNTNTAAGRFTLAGNASLATTGGSFTNAGVFTVLAGSTFTVGGSSFNFTQTAGTTTVNGTLASAGAGSLDLYGGALYGTGTLDYGVVDAATIAPGNSAATTGILQVDGTYAQSSRGALDVTIGGATAGTQYDQLNVTSTASLGGTLNIKLASGYTPAVGTTFDILNASAVSGDFSTINGLAINSGEHFTVTTVNGDEIVLTVVSGPAPAASVSLTQLTRAGVVHRRYGLGLYGGQRRLANVVARVPARVGTPRISRMPLAPVGRLPMGAQGFRPRDEFGSPAATLAATGTGNAGAAGSMGIAPVSAAAYNSMAAMNHMRFECGVDVKALLKTSPKRLLKALWAAPDSQDALDIGYMTLTTR